MFQLLITTNDPLSLYQSLESMGYAAAQINDDAVQVYAEDQSVLVELSRELGLTDAAIEEIDDAMWQQLWVDEVPSYETRRIHVQGDQMTSSTKPVILSFPRSDAAFGDGRHLSTRLALRGLDECVDENTNVVLDIGTGNGILAIASAKLGVGRVIATDLDASILAEAAANARSHGVTMIQWIETEEIPRERTDLTMANILAPVLVHLAPAICAQQPRRILLSGFQRLQWPQIEAAFGEDYREEWRCEENGWLAVVLGRIIR